MTTRRDSRSNVPRYVSLVRGVVVFEILHNHGAAFFKPLAVLRIREPAGCEINETENKIFGDLVFLVGDYFFDGWSEEAKAFLGLRSDGMVPRIAVARS